MSTPPHDVTELLHAWGGGDLDARERVVALVYEELRRRAAAHLRRERQGHTMQPTALVHEAWLRLVGPRAGGTDASLQTADGPTGPTPDARAGWESERHFLSVAARAMRNILVDHARARAAKKREGRVEASCLDELVGTFELRSLDLIELDQALARLQELDPELARLVELRFFAGLSIAETARALGVSTPTVERGWRSARAWLRRELPDAST